MNWQLLPNGKGKYHSYLTSREWKIKRAAVKKRAKNVCERCKAAPLYAVHHLTYERLYSEPLEDLQGLCDPCHQFLEGKSEHDPLKKIEPIQLIELWPDEWIPFQRFVNIGCVLCDISKSIDKKTDAEKTMGFMNFMDGMSLIGKNKCILCDSRSKDQFCFIPNGKKLEQLKASEGKTFLIGYFMCEKCKETDFTDLVFEKFRSKGVQGQLQSSPEARFWAVEIEDEYKISRNGIDLGETFSPKKETIPDEIIKGYVSELKKAGVVAFGEDNKEIV